MNNSEQIKKAVEFLAETTAANFFGEKTVTIVYHAGRVKRIEKAVCEKTQTE